MDIKSRNVNEAFADVFWRLRAGAYLLEQTRNGPAMVFQEPVIITYQQPTERVLFHAGRDCNPIFHLMESIWMLAGRRDVAFLQQFNSKIGQYSDDGQVFNAAYGYRWRRHFGRDQVVEVIEQLRRDPASRQAVIQMWDSSDLNKNTKDKACNTQLIFDSRGGVLNLTVFNRSNDIWWGALGANVVHFSVLQEVVAAAVQLPVGVYRQISNNLHLYTELYNARSYVERPPFASQYDRYSDGTVVPYPIMVDSDYAKFLRGCEEFCDHPFDEKRDYGSPFLKTVAQPMAQVSLARRSGAGSGNYWADRIRSPDWKLATKEWVYRRELAKAKTID